MIKIKDFATKTDFSIRMLRYLEEISLLIPKRDENNYRIYSEDQIEEAIWIKNLQGLGIQLKEIESFKSENPKEQISTLQGVLKREQEVAEIKSETIPQIKTIIDHLQSQNCTIQKYYQTKQPKKRWVKTLGGEDKFHRTAHSIPILRNIYEDFLADRANIKLIATDLLKFGQWLQEVDYIPDVYSVLHESSFSFGKNLTESFLSAYEESWKKFLPEMGFKQIADFTKEDVSQLLGPHAVIIRSTFEYNDSKVAGEIVIPYSPIYTMAQLSLKN